MDTYAVSSWSELEDWAKQWEEKLPCDDPKFSDGFRFVFRGQSRSTWPIVSSLARHLLAHSPPVKPDEWRRRELKMYRSFRERILRLCPRLYDDLCPLEILSLMQHHGVPTRVIDFTERPLIAAYFALIDASDDSAIWVVDRLHINSLQVRSDLPEYAGPTHKPGYAKARKHDGATVVRPLGLHPRIAAQRGCFLIPGRISPSLPEHLLHTKVVLSESVIFEAKLKLSSHMLTRDLLFPDLDAIAKEVKSFSTSSNPDFADCARCSGRISRHGS
jgi:hypothetical protein